MAKAKEITELDCSAGALKSAVKILRVWFKEIIEINEKTLDLSDVDFIHDLRVATRRLRSALRDFMPLLERELFKEIKEDLKEIADALGKVRDEDVAIEALQNLQIGAENDLIKAQIGLFLEQRNDSREAARLELEKLLTDEKLEELEKEFTGNLHKILHSKEPHQTISFKEFGKAVIGKNLEEFENLIPSLFEPVETEKLHRLRIHAKRLRYAMKVFAGCLGEEAKPLAKKVSKMQTFLGDAHDCDVWIEKLLELLLKSHLTKIERETMIWILSEFFAQRVKNYTAALKLWSDWQADYFLAGLKTLTL